jgi:hypothetical protein
VLALLLAGCDAGSAANSTPTSGTSQAAGTTQPGADNSQAAAYCTEKGGKVVTRYLAYGTIRGADLTQLIRYQPTNPTPVIGK